MQAILKWFQSHAQTREKPAENKPVVNQITPEKATHCFKWHMAAVQNRALKV